MCANTEDIIYAMEWNEEGAPTGATGCCHPAAYHSDTACSQPLHAAETEGFHTVNTVLASILDQHCPSPVLSGSALFTWSSCCSAVILNQTTTPMKSRLDAATRSNHQSSNRKLASAQVLPVTTRNKRCKPLQHTVPPSPALPLCCHKPFREAATLLCTARCRPPRQPST